MSDKELIEEALRFEKRLENYNYAFGDEHGQFRQEYREDIRRNDKEIIQRLVKRVEDLQPEPKSIVWEPKKGERYWYVDIDGRLNSHECRYDEEDEDLLKHHNVYKTQAQAEKAAKYQRQYNMVLQAVLNLEPDQVVDWSDVNQTKYTVYFNHDRCIWERDCWRIMENGYPVLTDKKNVQPLLDYLNAKEGSDE